MIVLVGWFLTNVRTCDKGRLWPTDKIKFSNFTSSFRYFRVSNQASSSLNQDGGGVDGDYERTHFSHVQCSWGRLPPDFQDCYGQIDKLTKGQKEEGNAGQVIKKRSAWRK